EKCNGCGLCVPNCAEGALQIIDGKARLVGDMLCDGLGACVGHCPQGAITVVEREAAKYDEQKVIKMIISQGPAVIRAHLGHLKEHDQSLYLSQALDYLKKTGIEIPPLDKQTSKQEKSGEETATYAPFSHTPGHDDPSFPHPASFHASDSACPGSRMMDFSKKQVPALDSLHPDSAKDTEEGRRPSHLMQWPIQLHLVSPDAPYFQKRDIVLAADCVAYALGDFHKDYLKGKSLAIACPKLDSHQEVYTAKITALIDEAHINTLTVIIMQVPCCRGLVQIAHAAAQSASRTVPVKMIVVGIQGDIQEESWLPA
ncbi:4Fe-4S ferredoxin, partial [Candidatus Woesearchaeota archaeon CG_4_10_14_0_8_um_filter_47_5]